MSSNPFDHIEAPIAPDPLAPTIRDVAALIRARTKDSSGNEVGNFTADTRPTDEQAQEAIDHAIAAVHRAVGNVGPGCVELGRLAVAYGAAAEIELSYFPEQARADRSPYTFLIARAQELLDGLTQCVAGNLPGGSLVGGDLDGENVRYGTLKAIPGTVHDYYTRAGACPIPILPKPPAVNPPPVDP